MPTTHLNQITYMHIVTAELHTGMLVLATACVIIRVFGEAYLLKFAKLVPPQLKFIEDFLRWVIPYTDRTSVIAMMGGIGAFLVSMISGFYVWENGRPFNEGVMKNKVFFSCIAFTLWNCAIIIRLRLGDNLWNIPRQSNMFVLTVVGAMGFTVFSGALGARLTVGHCFFDPFFHMVGWDPANTLEVTPGTSMLLTLSGLVFLVAYYQFAYKSIRPNPSK